MQEREEDKSSQLIRTVLELFMKFGIKSLTMDDISRKLGISKKTLYQFVKDKKDLVKKGMVLCLEDEQNMIAEITKESNNAIDELIEITKCANARLTEMHASVIYDIQKYHPESWILMENHKKEFVKGVILENTKRGIEEGYYRDNLNPEVIASLYIIMIDSLFHADENFGKEVSLGDLHLEMIRYHVKGIANEKGIALLKKTLKKSENNHLHID
jgi:AcrR family transcriptional regulator